MACPCCASGSGGRTEGQTHRKGRSTSPGTSTSPCSQRVMGAAPARPPCTHHLSTPRTNAGIPNGWLAFSRHNGDSPGTTGDHRGPLPRPATEHDHEAMARTTARVICTLPGTRFEPPQRGPRPAPVARKPPTGSQLARHSPGPPPTAYTRGSRTKITVRAFVSPMCRDHPKWTLKNHDTQGRGHKPKPGQTAERNARSTPPSGSATLTRRPRPCTPPRAGRTDAINDDPVNRTRVRAKMRVVVIRRHLRREMKKASRAGPFTTSG